jgi:predicted nucleic acid binding AN1-type Zn finger protein
MVDEKDRLNVQGSTMNKTSLNATNYFSSEHTIEEKLVNY